MKANEEEEEMNHGHKDMPELTSKSDGIASTNEGKATEPEVRPAGKLRGPVRAV